MIVQQEEPSVAFFVVFHPEFDKRLVLDRDFADQVLDNSIFVPLRENLESNSSEIGVRR